MSLQCRLYVLFFKCVILIRLGAFKESSHYLPKRLGEMVHFQRHGALHIASHNDLKLKVKARNATIIWEMSSLEQFIKFMGLEYAEYL